MDRIAPSGMATDPEPGLQRPIDVQRLRLGARALDKDRVACAQKERVVAPSATTPSMAADPAISTPSMKSAASYPRTLAQGGQT